MELVRKVCGTVYKATYGLSSTSFGTSFMPNPAPSPLSAADIEVDVVAQTRDADWKTALLQPPPQGPLGDRSLVPTSRGTGEVLAWRPNVITRCKVLCDDCSGQTSDFLVHNASRRSQCPSIHSLACRFVFHAGLPEVVAEAL